MPTLVYDDELAIKTPLSVPTRCRVKVFERGRWRTAIVVSEMQDNAGMGIAEAAEFLWPQVIARAVPELLDQADQMYLLERYPLAGGVAMHRNVIFDNYSPVIEHSANGDVVRFRGVRWEVMDPKVVKGLTMVRERNPENS